MRSAGDERATQSASWPAQRPCCNGGSRRQPRSSSPSRRGGFADREIVFHTAVAAAPTTSGLQAFVAPRLSIVVLPFANLSDDLTSKYFADGITEDLTTDLSRDLE